MGLRPSEIRPGRRYTPRRTQWVQEGPSIVTKVDVGNGVHVPTNLPAAVVLTRMTSSRLPGKALRTVAGRPLLGYAIDRLRHASVVGAIVVATSDDPSDDPIEAFCRSEDVAFHRGSLNDVAARALDAARSVGAEWWFRANGDSPLLAVDLYPDAVEVAASVPGVELVSNVHPRVVPPGASVELIRSDAMQRALVHMNDEEREHVTMHLYRHDDRFHIERLGAGGIVAAPGCRLVVDNPDDLERFAALITAMDHPHWTYGTQDVLDLLQRITS